MRNYRNLNHWYQAKVLKGNKIGRTINFPTINLDPKVLSNVTKQGVYASLVKAHGKTYQGAAFYGARKVLKEIKTVLEIHLLEFDKNIYDEEIGFCFKRYIRGVKDFKNLTELKQQLYQDVQAVKSHFSKVSP